jgi:predicted secreted protein
MSSEQRVFIFAVTFIIIFSGLLVAMPTDLQGQSETPDIVTPVDPSLLTGFATTTDWNMSDFTAYSQYIYNFNSRDWVFSYYAGTIQLGAKVLIGGVLWFGQLDSCEFISVSGENRGAVLDSSEIGEDADNGTVKYDIRYIVDGTDAGGFIVYWNTTAYATISLAFAADDVYFLHGAGVSVSAAADVGSLLIDLLLLQLPDCPPLINLLLATPIYASVVFLIWYILKETMPFV